MIEPSVMILIQNEEYWLPYVLKQTEDIFNSYVIYDVGSSDSTRRIIEWWMDNHSHQTVYRPLPNCPPEVQGTFRNSMIAEGKREIYFILDGDELYKSENLRSIRSAADTMIWTRTQRVRPDLDRRYGVFKRIEVIEDLTKRYKEERTHHRLYTKDAYWTGTHPGEIPVYSQNKNSEMYFNHIKCWHMHNTLRSSKEADATKRIMRKSQKTYHPGTELIEMNLLEELPILKNRIESFEVNPALKLLQEQYHAN